MHIHRLHCHYMNKFTLSSSGLLTKLLGGGQRRHSFALSIAISQVSTCQLLTGVLPCVGICQANVLIGNAKQATTEGKRVLVENRLTSPAASALRCV